jgi:antitoxin component YwqK of YwqJK toxin-antitoxin module
MNFQITDGLNKVSIKLSEIGNYFHFKKPITTVWYDCRGSVGKYLCQLPYDKEYRNEVLHRIIENLNTDYTERAEELYALITPLLRLFPNGEYKLNYYHSNNNKYFQYTSSRDNHSIIHQFYWCPIFSKALQLTEQETKIKEHETFVNERKKQKQIYWDLVEYTTTNFYDGNERVFIATQPKFEINDERVKHFENLIEKGERPFAIIFNCHYLPLVENTDKTEINHYESLSSESYIIDGHHKLQAYYNLKITPSIVEITHLPKTRDEVEFNIEELIEVLYPWQIEHILKNWDEKEKYILKFLKNPESKIHNFIKNGHHKEFYKNGKLKHEAFYINDKIEGEGFWWFENGQMEKNEIYKNGMPIGEWTSWYESGKILLFQRFYEFGGYDKLISYYESGQIRMEQIFENGMIKDGYSYLHWFENGAKEAELKYLNGQMIERKNYNRQGQLINFEEFDSIEQKFVKRV